MSVKVERDGLGKGFDLKLDKVRRKSHAKDFDELTNALAHYFGIGPYHKGTKSGCPLCREMQQEAGRKGT